MQDYAKALQDMTWSFSRIHSYEQCPYEFYLNYLFKDEDGHRIYEGEDNFYGAFGSFCHELLAAVFNREISAEEAYIFLLYSLTGTGRPPLAFRRTGRKTVVPGCLRSGISP